MLQLTGIRVLAKELETHQGWDPRFGVWEAQLKKISEEKAAAAPSILPDLEKAKGAVLPQLKIFWRGPGTIGDSLGNLSFESLLVLLRLGFKDQLRFGLLSKWNPREELKESSRLAQVLELRADSYPEAQLEIQIPGTSPSTLQNCVRFFFHEFGYFYNFEVGAKDALWAPSHFLAAKLRQAFPKNLVFCAPHGVNLEIYNPQVAAHPKLKENTFRFLYVGTTISRKGIDLLLKAFAEEKEHLGDAELWLKVFPTTSGFIWPEIYKQGNRVKVVDEAIPATDMAQLMRACNVLVAPSRAEAFCMPALEAMACALPCIIPVGSAMQEFCSGDSSFLVESEEVQIPNPKHQLSYLEPDLLSLRKALREAYEQRERLPEKGKLAAQAAKNFTWENVTRMALLKSSQAFGLSR